MKFLTIFIIYVGIAFFAFLMLLWSDLLEIRCLGDFIKMIFAVLLWPIILIFNIYSFIKDKLTQKKLTQWQKQKQKDR